MRNLFVILFFVMLLLGGGYLFGQEEALPCDCNTVNLTSIVINEGSDGCYYVKVDIDERCVNYHISSIMLKSEYFPACFKKRLEVQNLNSGKSNKYDLRNTNSIVLYSNEENITSGYNWKICAKDGDSFNCDVNPAFNVDVTITLSYGNLSQICLINQKLIHIYSSIENENSGNGINIIPNPIENVIKLSGIEKLIYDEIKIFNSQGIEVYKLTNHFNVETIYTKLVNGVFSLQIYNKGTLVKSKEFIKND